MMVPDRVTPCCNGMTHSYELYSTEKGLSESDQRRLRPPVAEMDKPFSEQYNSPLCPPAKQDYFAAARKVWTPVELLASVRSLPSGAQNHR
jgi:hypothetical protein